MSGFEITMEINQREFDKARRILKEFPQKAPKMIAESMNRAANVMKTEIARGISKRYNLTQTQVKPYIFVLKANAHLLEAIVKVSDYKKSAWHLYDFKVTPRMMGMRPKGGLRVGVLRGNAERFRGAFIAQMASGHVGVFWRTGKPRRPPIRNTSKRMITPITEGFSPTPAVMASQSVITKDVEAKGYATFEKRMDHAIDFLMKQR